MNLCACSINVLLFYNISFNMFSSNMTNLDSLELVFVWLMGCVLFVFVFVFFCFLFWQLGFYNFISKLRIRKFFFRSVLQFSYRFYLNILLSTTFSFHNYFIPSRYVLNDLTYFISLALLYLCVQFILR